MIFRIKPFAAALLVPLLIAGCADEIPTATDPGLFPGGLQPETVESIVPAEAFIEVLGRFDGYRSRTDAPYRIVANEFEGLQANTLVRLTGFPQAVTYTVDDQSITDSVFTYVGGTLQVRADTLASDSEGPITLQVWSLAEEWDPATVSWEMAVDTAGDRRAWAVPGGTPNRLLAEIEWDARLPVPGGEAAGDTLRWELDADAVVELAAEESSGLVVRAVGAQGRIQLRHFSLTTRLDPESADTLLERTVSEGPQTFVHTPAFDAPEEVILAGGVTAFRTLMRLQMPTSLNGQPLADVGLNRVELVLSVRDTGDGYRPLAPMQLRLRRVAEPELGAEAPLGQLVTEVTAERVSFTEAGEVRFDLTAWARRMVQEERGSMDLALLAEPLANWFGVAAFEADPRLRILYTTSSSPQLP